jgi:archaellum biogenesis ATPase FlaH
VQKLLESRVKGAEQLKDPAHVRVAVLGIFRITMQHACVALGEWIVGALREHPSRLSGYTSVDIAAYSQPADGSLVSLLSQLLVAAENVGWRSVGRQYWEQVNLPEELRLLTGSARANLETVLTAFVRTRNDGAEGHGLPGGYSPQTDIAVVRALLQGVTGILPVVAKPDGKLLLPSYGDRPSEELVTLRLFDGNPICYRRLRRTSAGRVQVDAQIQKTLLTRSDVTYEVQNILLDLPRAATPEYDIVEPTWTDSWKPFVHIPDRLASSEVFTGRAKEMRALADWADDPDSRKCMVWGDGGVGKTTLVVEFLHRMLEGTAAVEWQPELITFYTAKKTRWGLQGLEQISAQDIGVADVALDVARMLTSPNLERSWFDKSPREVIQKLATLLAEMKITRDAHLIVLDNTETMTRSDADLQALAAQINELSRRVGRVILTSRRREQIEALPIQTENWTDTEGAEFLRKRGGVLRCTSIQQAGDATLRKYSRLLVNKPIALEVFVQAASAPGVGLDDAFQRVQRMQRQDLGQFLYDDAWARLSPEMRRVLLLMSRLGDSHDQYLMQLCCQRTDVTVAAASEAIEESRGIASVSRFEGTLQVTFNPEFYNYCIERWELIDGKKTPTDEDVDWVRRRYAEFVASASAQVYDRNVRAFRVPAARAAWKSFTENRLEAALDYYEIAALADPDNGWLFDRFAYTLMKMRRLDLAFEKSRKAVQLLPTDPEAHFTAGMIASRLGSVADAVKNLDRSAELGKPRHLCELQKAYAHVYSKPANIPEARACVEQAKRSAPKDKFLSRFIDEATRFQRRWLPSDSM